MTNALLFLPFPPDSGGNLPARRAAAFLSFYRDAGLNPVCVSLGATPGFELSRDLLNARASYDLRALGEYAAVSQILRDALAQTISETGPAFIHLGDIHLAPAVALHDQAPSLIIDQTASVGLLHSTAVRPAFFIASNTSIFSALEERFSNQKVLNLPNGRRRLDNPSAAALEEVGRCMKGQRYAALEIGGDVADDSLVLRLFRDGCFLVPPAKSLAVVGAAGERIFQSSGYQRFLAANSDRVHFFANPPPDLRKAVLAGAHVHVLPAGVDDSLSFSLPDDVGTRPFMIGTEPIFKQYDNVPTGETLLCPDPESIWRAIATTLRLPPLSPVDVAHRLWDDCFKRSGFPDALEAILTTKA